MSEIIPPSESVGKPILTAQEMFQLWNWKRSDEVEVCEFAEAYAAAYMNWYAEIHVANNARQNNLLRRAAELLRLTMNCYTPPHSAIEQWLKDVEGK